MLRSADKTRVLHLVERLPECAQAAAPLTLPYALRQKSRQRVRLDDGREAALVLPRGTVLRHGDCLRAEEGAIVRVIAAAEAMSTAFSSDPLLLTRAAYHLGNRHVPIQVGMGWLRYLQDHVLDAMLCQQGLDIIHEWAPFQPEAGAYQHGH